MEGEGGGKGEGRGRGRRNKRPSPRDHFQKFPVISKPPPIFLLTKAYANLDRSILKPYTSIWIETVLILAMCPSQSDSYTSPPLPFLHLHPNNI